jgi:hypothetical protein
MPSRGDGGVARAAYFLESPGLFFEKAIECVARIARVPWRGRVHARNRQARPIPVRLQRAAFARHSNARRKESAIICLVLNGDSNRNRLRALESSRRLKVRALLAAVQLSAALRAWSVIGRARRQGRGTVIAAGSRYGLNEAGKAGACRHCRFRGETRCPRLDPRTRCRCHDNRVAGTYDRSPFEDPPVALIIFRRLYLLPTRADVDGEPWRIHFL